MREKNRFSVKRLLPFLLAIILLSSLLNPAATFAVQNEFVLSYDSNGANGDAPSSVMTSEGGQATTASPALNALKKTAYIFAGWNTQADGQGDLYAPGATITLTENTTLYAAWGLLFEGEHAELLESAQVESGGDDSFGGKHVGYLTSDGSGVKFNNLPASNAFVLHYATEYEDGTISLYVNDEYEKAISFTTTESWTSYNSLLVDVAIEEGDSVSIIIKDEDDTAINIDAIGLVGASKVDVEELTLNTPTVTLAPYYVETLTASVSPANASYKVLTWSSSNPTVATVDENGKVKALTLGTTTITATSQDNPAITATTKVTVAIPVGEIPYAVDISGGEYDFIALMSDGTVITSASQNQDAKLKNSDEYNEDTYYLVETAEGNTLKDTMAISAFNYHNLALDQNGQVWAWGSNYYYESGSLENEYVENATLMEAFIDNNIDIQAISAGSYHSLALDSEGKVWAWGDNSEGQLGNDGEDDEYTPQQVVTEDGILENIVSISAGNDYSLALDEDGRIWAWGDGSDINGGDGAWYTAHLLSEEGDVFTAISAGDSYSFAVDSEGDVRIWGQFRSPSTGDVADYFYNNTLEFEHATADVSQVYVTKNSSSSSYIKLSDGTYWCWGMCLDEEGKYAYVVNKGEPQLTTELNNFIAVTSLYQKTVGLKSDNTVWMGNTYTSFNNWLTPQQATVTDVVYATAGNYLSIVLKSDKRGYAFGENYNGQLGQYTTAEYLPYDVENPSPVKDNKFRALENLVAVDAGDYHALALTDEGDVWAWGYNYYYQVSDVSDSDVSHAVQINGLSNVIAISAGGYHNLALKSDGTAVAWGNNGNKQVNSSDSYRIDTPVPVTDGEDNVLSNIKAVSAGSYHSVVITGDEGYVWTFGGDRTNQYITTDGETRLEGIVAIAAGSYWTLALKNDGTVWEWWTDNLTAKQVKSNETPLTNIKQISLTQYHGFAVDEQGEVWAWGDNYIGQLGLGHQDYLGEPQKVNGLSNVKHIATGYNHTLAVLTDGTVYSFGSDSSRSLGLPLVKPILELVQITAFKAKGTYYKDNTNQDNSYSPLPNVTTNGQLTVPVGQSGQAIIDNELTLSVPVGSSDELLMITLDKVSNTANLAKHGEIFASSVFELLKNVTGNFKKAVTLTFKFDPSILKEGQRVAIFYYDEVLLEWVEIGGKVTDNLISSEVDHFTKFAVLVVDETSKLPFLSDVTGHWAEAQIMQAVQQGIVNGYPDGTFKPNATITRAEFTTMLINALRLDEESETLNFIDEQQIGDWAKPSIAKALKAGVVSGYDDGSFRPQAHISRAQLAVMIARANGMAETEQAESTGFNDNDDTPSWAKSAIAYVRQSGIVNGRGDNIFAPNANATRAEAVTIILNMLNTK